MEQQENYNLTWHSHSDHMKVMISDMLTSAEFADVTLVCDDMKKIRAHKNILGACSPVFKSILQADPTNGYPLVYLRGIPYAEMQSILQFMYLGQTYFQQDKIIDLLQVAKKLEIKNLELNKMDINKLQPVENEDCSLSNETNIDKNIKSNESEIMNICREFNENIENYTGEVIEYSDYDSNNIQISNDENVSKPPRQEYTIASETKYGIECTYNYCNLCKFRTKKKSDLRKHIESIHEGITYACDQCDYLATQQGHLKEHIQAKHEGVMFGCSKCNKQFSFRSGLNRHYRIVHDEGVRVAKFQCQDCEKRFSDPSGLRQHTKSKHEGVRYACNQCDFQATTGGHLTYHIQSVHEGIKYACNQCDSQFTQQGNLTTHIQSIHEGVKYACYQCGKQYTEQSSLTKHIKTIHEGVKYACNQCDYQAPRQDKLTTHLKRKHL